MLMNIFYVTKIDKFFIFNSLKPLLRDQFLFGKYVLTKSMILNSYLIDVIFRWLVRLFGIDPTLVIKEALAHNFIC